MDLLLPCSTSIAVNRSPPPCYLSSQRFAKKLAIELEKELREQHHISEDVSHGSESPLPSLFRQETPSANS